jgi:predicted amidohydrolase YtcJ
MLIRNAEIPGCGIADLRVRDERIAAIGHLAAESGETVFDAGGGALLTGLHDHHLHFLAFAASFNSVRCGPPEVTIAEELVQALRAAAGAPGGWIRGIGYHETVAGEIDRAWLDRAVPDRPIRLQHRGGRLWVLNSRALEKVLEEDEASPELRATGRLYDGDTWLRKRLSDALPPLGPASRYLASRGVTDFTDASPTNSAQEAGIFHDAIRRGELIQSVMMMGSAALEIRDLPGLVLGATKIHLREAALPPFDETTERIVHSHAAQRPVAVHCVTLAELIFTLAAFEDTGTIAGDRIEHAGIVPPDALPRIARLGLTIVTQPNFIAERGDAYLQDVDSADHASLYRLRSFLDAGIGLGGGTDAPFGHADPWAAMAAAVSRQSKGGHIFGPDEALTPERALALFQGDPHAPGGQARTLVVGARADLCLIDRPWAEARRDLAAVGVAMTLKAGRIVHRG